MLSETSGVNLLCPRQRRALPLLDQFTAFCDSPGVSLAVVHMVRRAAVGDAAILVQAARLRQSLAQRAFQWGIVPMGFGGHDRRLTRYRPASQVPWPRQAIDVAYLQRRPAGLLPARVCRAARRQPRRSCRHPKIRSR
uniref:Uncharacterized protein n=1 Tax=Pseudomonas aeruginosa TaxID=287 RepID=A0A7G8ABA0_PSEAI|nr:Hypothetical protein [Pseudomonas aeruginosa]